jgi:histidinol-phosphate aminotransferase
MSPPFSDLDASLSDHTRATIAATPTGYVAKDRRVPAGGQPVPRLALNLGINPYGCAPEVLEHKQSLRHSKLHLYFEECFTELYARIARRHGTTPESIVISRGLDHMLMMITTAFLNPGERVLSLSPSFFLFEEYSRLRGAELAHLELSESDSFDWTQESHSRYAEALRLHAPKLFFIANPNNPTGRSIDLRALGRIVEAAEGARTIVVVDEAYGEFTDGPDGVSSATSLQSRYANLIVLRTLSKGMGLADLRVGYAVANPRWAQALNLHRAYFPFTSEIYSIATFALSPEVALPFLRDTRKRLEAAKLELYRLLEAIPRIAFVPTETNILMIRHEGLSARELIGRLGLRGISVSTVTGPLRVANAYIRVTIGTMDDMREFAGALAEISASAPA